MNLNFYESNLDMKIFDWKNMEMSDIRMWLWLRGKAVSCDLNKRDKWQDTSICSTSPAIL